MSHRFVSVWLSPATKSPVVHLVVTREEEELFCKPNIPMGKVVERVTGPTCPKCEVEYERIKNEEAAPINHRAYIRQLLVGAVSYARHHIATAPDHAGFPNHRADETVRDLLEEVIYDDNA